MSVTAALVCGLSQFCLESSDAAMNGRSVILRTAATDAGAENDVAGKVAADIRGQLARRMGMAEAEFQVDVENLRLDPSPGPADVASVQVLGLGSMGARRLEGLFNLPLVLQIRGADGTREQEVQASGVLKVTGPVFVTRANLPRGHLIERGDLNAIRLPWRTLASGSFAIPEGELVGRRVKSLIPSGQPFAQALVDEPFAVRPGEIVDLTVVSGPGVMIRSRAVARQEGKVGDIVRIEQADTKKPLTAVVTAAKSVEVRL